MGRRMRIAQLAPLWETVPPPAYGGIEAVVYVLTEELVRRGHQVTLFASGDSLTSAHLNSVWPVSLRTAPEIVNIHPYQWLHVANALSNASGFDIIHNHQGELAMAFGSLIDTPMLTTVHNPPTRDSRIVWERYRWYYNTVSRSGKKGMPDRNYLGVVYNSIDVSAYPFSARKDGYLLYLGRMSREKGPEVAIEVARRLGQKLIMAGKVGVEDVDHFTQVVKPMIDGNLVEFIGEADSKLKRQLYLGASCLLFPIKWNEPFGLVIVEAMACGTPVVAFRQGAAREIILNGKTGYLVKNLDEMVSAVQMVESIDPAACRQSVEEKYTPSRLATDYLSLYQKILGLSTGSLVALNSLEAAV